MISNFIGKDGFTWWLGVVESNQDPLNLGRCQVRIFGWHTGDMQKIPTSNLPWALPMNSPNMSMLAAAPLVGDYAFGFFSDGISGQSPYMIGIFPGIPQKEPDSSSGFSEGSHYPIGEPTTSRLYRNEKIEETSIGYNDSNLDTGVETAAGETWDEPPSGYATTTANNRVIETVSGHIFEMDDTPGAERIHLNHKANTFFQIDASGNMVTKVSGKNYEIYLSDNNIHVKGACNITVDGDAGIYVKGNLVQKVDGDVTENITGKVDLTVTGNFNATAPEFNLKGTLNVDGNINSTADIKDKTRTMSADRALYDLHIHTAPFGPTSPPLIQQ